MFTGIIEEIGQVKNVVRGVSSSVVTISADVIFSDLKLGDSVAVNGVCLTVSTLANKAFTADVMHETLRHSSLGSLKSGTSVNLERAMAANGRFGGHIVSGHIDGVGSIAQVTRDDNAVIYRIEAGSDIVRYVVRKGSIAIDGISLTVTAVDDCSFSVSIIPHTLGETILGTRDVSDVVNLEVDVMAKYVEKLLNVERDVSSGDKVSNITSDFLAKNGF